jgi:hypothetical protein
MNQRSSVTAYVTLLLAVVVVSAVAFTARVTRQVSPDNPQLSAERNMPGALVRHLERFQAIPGNGGESEEGPGGGDLQKFLEMAYPDTDIPLERFEAARSSAAAVLGRDFPTGKGQPGAWVTYGPSNALYPATIFRSSSGYVPARYVAGGRATALAIDPNCRIGSCRLWVFAAGGGLWRTNNALSGEPSWQYLSGSFGINSGSSIVIDPNDPTGNTLYVGTGEANASADSAAGAGMFKSTDGGDTWTGPLGTSVFNGRSIGTIAIVPGEPDTIYAGTTRGVLGVSSVNGGGVSLIPGAAPWGLYKSTDGGATWTFLHDGAPTAAECDTVAEENPPPPAVSPCSIRGVRRVAIDPSNPSTIYAGSYARGVWRSTDAGATWTQIKASLEAANASMRPEIAVTALPGGATRMYVYEGASGTPTSRLFRSDSVATGTPTFTNLSSSNVADPGYGTHNVCTGQCWYDNFVYTPAGYPDIVYVGGSYTYGERYSNKRGVMLSTDAGVTSTDMTMDATDAVHPNGLHPDQHALVTNPSNPFQFFEVNDGGLMRSSGAFADVSSWCDQRGSFDTNPDPPDLHPARLARCKQLLSRVPTELASMNKGLTTLQFQSVSVSPFNANIVQGGTQDNGTWETPGNPVKWENTMIGDGGQSGFDVADPSFRFHTFYDAQPDVNFSKGDIADWNWIGDPFFVGLGGAESRSFYIPIIADPSVSRTMFAGLAHVWRTRTWGMGTMDLAEFRKQCNEWFGLFETGVTCGDWEPLGTATTDGRLTGTLYGADRTGGFVAAVERATTDSGTLWAATQTGRLFISKNADADPVSAVTFTRLDSLATNDPNRFVTGIHIDPANTNRAWVSYSGFSGTTPTTPGHVFLVTYDPGTATATWTDLSSDLGDIPVNDVVCDDASGDLYAATDFGVFRRTAANTTWTVAAPGMPRVEVAGLTIVPAARKLYAATHGLGAWVLNLP